LFRLKQDLCVLFLMEIISLHPLIYHENMRTYASLRNTRKRLLNEITHKANDWNEWFKTNISVRLNAPSDIGGPFGYNIINLKLIISTSADVSCQKPDFDSWRDNKVSKIKKCRSTQTLSTEFCPFKIKQTPYDTFFFFF